MGTLGLIAEAGFKSQNDHKREFTVINMNSSIHIVEDGGVHFEFECECLTERCDYHFNVQPYELKHNPYNQEFVNKK